MNLHGRDIKIFSANANPKLAKEMSEYLGLPLGKSEVGRFSDGEIAVSIFESVRGSDVFVVQPTSTPVNSHLMELLIMIDAFKRASAGRVTAVVPYYGYARQDRKSKGRDPITAKLVADMITAAGADRILTMDLHAPQIQGFFNIPVDHLVGMPTLVEYYRETVSENKENFMIVSPDTGSIGRVRDFAQRLELPIAIVDKRRQKANESEVMNIIGDVEGKDILLYDDLIDTAGTICNAAATIKEKGAKSIRVCATHPVLSGPAIANIQNSPIEELVMLDTIAVPEEKLIDKITILPSAHVFAEAVSRIYSDKPISPLVN